METFYKLMNYTELNRETSRKYILPFIISLGACRNLSFWKYGESMFTLCQNCTINFRYKWINILTTSTNCRPVYIYSSICPSPNIFTFQLSTNKQHILSRSRQNYETFLLYICSNFPQLQTSKNWKQQNNGTQ